MRLNQLLLELHSMDVYAPELWEEYLRYFVNSEQHRKYIMEHQKTDQSSKDTSNSLIARIRSNKGVDSAEVDPSISPKVVSVDYLSSPEVRSGITLGIVSGSFDLLHLGHVRYMVCAKEYLKGIPNPKLCALTLSDKHIRAKKGEHTPIMNVNERLEMICGVECVDYAIVLKESNCLVALAKLKPDYFFKAERDAIWSIVKQEEDLVESYGGSVVIFPKGPSGGRTTGQIIEKVLRGD